MSERIVRNFYLDWRNKVRSKWIQLLLPEQWRRRDCVKETETETERIERNLFKYIKMKISSIYRLHCEFGIVTPYFFFFNLTHSIFNTKLILNRSATDELF